MIPRNPFLTIFALGASLSLVATGQAAPPVPSAPAASTVSSTEDWIDIQVAPTIDEPAMAGWLRQAAERAAAPVLADHPPQWQIDIDLSGTSYDYRLKVVPFRNTVVVGPPPEALPCPCTTEELLQKVDTQVSAALEELQAAERAASAEPPPPSSAAPGSASLLASPSPEARGGIGAPGIIGIVAGGVGAGLFAYGLTMAIKGDEVLSENPEFTDVRRNGNPGTYAMLGIGAGVLATGIVLIIVDQAVCRSRPRGCRRVPPPHYGTSPLAPNFRF